MKSKFKCFPIYDFINKKEAIVSDLSSRSELDIGSVPDPINKNILDSLKYFIPFDLLEGFDPIYKKALANTEKHRPQRIVTGLGFFFNAEFAVWASLSSKKGTHIYGCQHGGGYGEHEMISEEYFERQNCDTFLTWGWSDGPNAKPFFSPQLSSGLYRHKEKKETNKKSTFLWVTTGDSKFEYFIDSVFSGERLYFYFETQR